MPGATEIRYDTDEMDTQAGQLESLADDLDGEAGKMTQVINALEASWSGQEFEAFMQEYTDFQTIQQNFSQSVRNFASHIRTTVDMALEQDQARKSAAEQLVQG